MKYIFYLEGILCVCEVQMRVYETLVCLKGISVSVFVRRVRPPLHSTQALPLNFSSLLVQFVHNLAVNDLSFVCRVCVCQWQCASG